MIHYHGTPITPRGTLYELRGKHFCVSYARPDDAEICAQIGQSVMYDNGAFSAYTQGREVDWHGYFRWLEPRLGHPHWAVIPDEIGGDVEAQRHLVRQWPYGPQLGAPVWHLHLSIDYLLELCDGWSRVCFGSSGDYWQVGSQAWERRVDEAFDALARRHQRLPWIHMLRGLACAGKRWPFASADSTNLARNHKRDAPHSPEYMARLIDGVQAPHRWTPAEASQPLLGEMANA